MRKGFTLIELLVVVLIISILAAIALPQYRVAVEKSRAAEMFLTVKTLKTMQDAYMLATGHYAQKFDDLDFEIPNSVIPSKFRLSSINDARQTKNLIFEIETATGWHSSNTAQDFFIVYYIADGTGLTAAFNPVRGYFTCAYSSASAKAGVYRQVCLSLGGKQTMTNGTFIYYILP